MFSSYKRVFWLAAVMSLFFFVPFNNIQFSTDVWTRMARIMEWANAGFPLKEQLFMSHNYPFGFELHWTRPLDFIGYAFAWPFIPNWGLKTALEIMAHFVPVLVMLIAVRGFFFGLKGYLTPKMAFIAFWLLFWGIGYSWGQASIGYFDHHIFHFALLIWSIALVARSFRLKDNTTYLVIAGLLSALGTWMTPEFFINIYILILPFAFGWLWHNRSLKPAVIYTGVYTLFLTLGMTFDHPIDGFWAMDFARTSMFHAILGGLNLIILSILSVPVFRQNKCRRLIYGLLALILLGLILLFGFKDVLLAPMVDPMMYHLWMYSVSEMRPLYESWDELVIYTILPLILAVGLSFWCIFSQDRRCVPLAIIAIAGTLFYATLIIFHVRVGISQSAFFLFLGACYLNLTFFPREKSFRRSLFFMVFYLVFIGIFLRGHASITQFKAWGIKHYLDLYKNDPKIDVPEYLKEAFEKVIQEEAKKADNNTNSEDNTVQYKEDKAFSCSSYDKIWKRIKGYQEDKAILTDIFSAPQIQWETGKAVLGGPYDRNIQGLLDLFNIELDQPPYTRAKALLQKHQIKLLYLQNPKCLDFIFLNQETKKEKESAKHSFHSAVYYETSDMPSWLKLEYHDRKTNIKIFRIID